MSILDKVADYLDQEADHGLGPHETGVRNTLLFWAKELRAMAHPEEVCTCATMPPIYRCVTCGHLPKCPLAC